MQFKSQQGFSLIELLIVITIMGLLGSIVMPNSFQMLEQHQAHLEQKKLIGFLQEQKYQAYLRETVINLEFAGTELTASNGTSIQFEFINADYQQIEVSELGRFKQEQVTYYLRGHYVEKVLGDL